MNRLCQELPASPALPTDTSCHPLPPGEQRAPASGHLSCSGGEVGGGTLMQPKGGFGLALTRVILPEITAHIIGNRVGA